MEKKLKIAVRNNGGDFGKGCEKPDFVPDDVFMPNLDIISVLKSIEEKLAVTVKSDSDIQLLKRKALNAGAGYYFLKPFDINTATE